MFADEGATLYSAHLSWANLWAQSQHVDRVLLPYYVLVHFWLALSGSIAWVRALSLFAFFGTIVVVGWTGLRLAGRWCGIIASVLTATSTILVEKSLNARPYELSTFLVVLCAVFLFRWLEDSRARWLWAFSILALLATAMQLFSLLAPVSMLFGVLVVRPELFAQRLRALFAPVALLGVVSCAWVVACIGEVGQVNWIANESIETRLLAEVRGPVVGQLYDFVLIVLAVVVVTKLAVVWNGGGRDAVVERVSQDREILGLTARLGDSPDVDSVNRLVCPSDLFRSVRVRISPRGCLAGGLRLCAHLSESARPSPPVGSDRRPKNANPNSRHRWRGSSCSLGHRLYRIGISTAGRSQGSGEYAAQHWEPGDVIALPDHAITSAIDYYLTNDRRPILPLAAAWSSAAICRRVRPLTAPVWARSPQSVARLGRQCRRRHTLRKAPRQRGLRHQGLQTVQRIVNPAVLLHPADHLDNRCPPMGRRSAGRRRFSTRGTSDYEIKVTKRAVRAQWHRISQNGPRVRLGHQDRRGVLVEHHHRPERHLLVTESGHECSWQKQLQRRDHHQGRKLVLEARSIPPQGKKTLSRIDSARRPILHPAMRAQRSRNSDCTSRGVVTSSHTHVLTARTGSRWRPSDRKRRKRTGPDRP